ncbi:MAG: hypothetical protein QOD63_1660 [Actinomycetota bacterium]|jgi:hypothetical protein|nr:hypothetical protein [Actinomycetota bacterium]
MRKVLVAVALASFVAVGLPNTPSPALAADQVSERLVRTRTSLLGTHRWYQQTYRGVDVVDGVVGEHTFRDGGSSKAGNTKPIADSPPVTPTVSAAQARAAAGPGARDAALAIKPGSPSRLVWSVNSVGSEGATRTLVDARDGSVVEVKQTGLHAEGTGTVFDPNPVVTLQDPTLTDAGDADLPVFGPAYRSVPLRHLDGSGFLRGDFADVALPDDRAVSSPSLAFDFDRSATGFSQTMAYFHVTSAQEYIQQLGFTDADNRPQQLLPDGTPDEASFYVPDPVSPLIVYGTGGVDDAEDADIIWHEYGHAIQGDQVLGFGAGGDASTIGEGFGDYWAVTMSQPVNGGYDVACVADWNSAGLATPRPCLRRVDTDLTLADRTGEAHFDGQIWSRALWDVNQRLGRDAANTLIIEAQFSYSPTTTFQEAAGVTVETARRLFGGAGAKVVRTAFADRGISSKAKPARGKTSVTKAPPGLHEVARLGQPAPGGSTYENVFEPYDLNDHSDGLFAADVGSGGQAVFVGDKGSAVDVARSGEPAPGGGVFGFGVEAGSGIDKDGNAAFSYFLDPFELPFGRNAGVYRSGGASRGGPGGTRAIVVPGQTPSPTGGVFVGAGENTSTNDRGAVAFAGMVETPSGIPGGDGLGLGIFLGRPDGSIAPLVVPGDPAPGGSTFDYAALPSVNAAGDVAFTGHVAGTPCESGAPQSTIIGCDRELFLRHAGTGQVVRLVPRGAGAPGGGTFLDVLHPVLGGNGDMLFLGVVGTDRGFYLGVFVVRNGRVEPIAREGDAMPGGGRFSTAGFQPGNADINDRGDAAFSATLDTDDNGDGLPDQGLYQWTAGKLTVVVRTGVVLPSGQVIALQPLAALGSYYPLSGAAINHSRHLLWQVTVVDAGGSLQTVLYTSG